MDLIATSFDDVSCSSDLALLNLGLLADIVHESHVVRSEFDVLNTIIRWLAKHGHSMDEELLADYEFEESVSAESTDKRASSVTTEEINTLTRKIRLDNFGLPGLKEGSDLCRRAHLKNLEKAFVIKFLTDLESFSGKHQFHIPKDRFASGESYHSHSIIDLAMYHHY